MTLIKSTEFEILGKHLGISHDLWFRAIVEEYVTVFRVTIFQRGYELPFAREFTVKKKFKRMDALDAVRYTFVNTYIRLYPHEYLEHVC